MKELIVSELEGVVISEFVTAQQGKPVMQRTKVTLRHDDKYLHVDFICEDDFFVKENVYTKDNSDMWNQEVFEVFIAGDIEHPNKYIELEINPNNALFLKKMTDNGAGKPRTVEVMDTATCGVTHNVQNGKNQWSGSLSMPLSLLSKQQGMPQVFKANFYRIILIKKPTHPQWAVTADNAIFACWSGTQSGEIPNFHVFKKFGKVTLI